MLHTIESISSVIGDFVTGVRNDLLSWCGMTVCVPISSNPLNWICIQAMFRGRRRCFVDISNIYAALAATIPAITASDNAIER